MKILIAGGAGYLGSVLVPMLHNRGHEVTVVDLFWFGNYLPRKTKILGKDLFDVTEEELRGNDIVMFLGGVSNDPMAEFDPAQNFAANAAGPAYLAFLSKRSGVKRFVYAGSCSVYGYAANEVYDENGPKVCQYPYGVSKLQGEYGAHQQGDSDFSVITLRQGTISGHSPRMRFDLIVNAMFKDAMLKKEITVNNSTIWRPINDIRDTAQAFVLAAESPKEVSGIFNITSGNYQIGEVAKIVQEELRALGVDQVKINVLDKQDMRNYRVSHKLAAQRLGFSPKYSISDIVRNLYENREKYGDYEDDTYYNIRIFQKLKKKYNRALGMGELKN